MENVYTKRKVAQNDTQCCLVCYKPTTCVLHNASIQDWFYCCELHLQDNPQFAKPIYPPGYEETLSKLKELKSKLDAQKARGAGTWDSWVNKLITRKAHNEKSSKEDTDKKDKKGSDDSATATTAPELQLDKEYQQTLDLITKYRENLRNYELSKVMFESRLDLKRRAHVLKAKRQREQEAYTNTDPEVLQAQFSFPDVPKS